MTRQTRTAAVSAVLFVVLSAVIALAPVPYVTWSPGETHNVLGKVGTSEAISISGLKTYAAEGSLLMTTISVTAPEGRVSLPEALISYWLPARAVLPRDIVYRSGVSSTDLTAEETQLMVSSQSTAVVAALRTAGVAVSELPMVASVSNSGPSNGILQAGDLISAVDNKPVETVAELRAAIKNRHVGQKVVFTVIRGTQTSQQTVTTRATSTNPDEPIAGITVEIGYRYAPKVTFAIDQNIGGPSAGLVFALAIYDRITTGTLVGDRTVAGTGTITADGKVGEIGGVQEKLAGAARDGATVFLIPKSNCADLGTVPASVRVVPVTTLKEAISSLQSLGDAKKSAGLPVCS